MLPRSLASASSCRWLAALLVAGPIGCATASSSDATDDADAGASPDGGPADASGARDARDAGDAAACTDASTSAVCLGPATYVSLQGSDKNDGTTPARAVQTVSRGITLARTCAAPPCIVRVAEGTYDHEVTLAGGVTVEGGWDTSFSARDATKHATVITSSATRTVSGEGLGAATKLDGLTIQGARLGGATGRSSTALWLSKTNAVVTLSNVTVIGGAAEVGADGAPGTVSTCNAAGGKGGSATDCNANDGTAGNAGGDAVHGGAGGPAGDSYCLNVCPVTGSIGISDGSAGEAGGDGVAGVGGPSPTGATGLFMSGEWLGPPSRDGARGGHGTGGGGGGAGGTKRFRTCFGCDSLIGGSGADGAAGGCGGGGGKAGAPGGAAFGIVAIDSTVAIAGNVIVRGGRAGDGGAGGDGVDGAPGATPAGTPQGGPSQKCGLIDYSAGGGGVGGAGGKGGAGGGGAGGVGGPSFGIALVGKASLDKQGTLTVTAGVAGRGGLGGKGPGSAGQPGVAGIADKTTTY